MKQFTNEAIEALYNQYLETVTPDTNVQEARLSGLNHAMDDMVAHKGVTLEAVAMYEEAARCAGFYAGVQAAIAMMAGE